ncbi:MAG: glycine zipper domain-containing protein [Parasphingorhabdus sp.]|uniref:glycine zipper domain-containing protein n=1 Tax=Parasphingorhabdus sp. TaxID=2709688 RepID=UPI0032967C6C
MSLFSLTACETTGSNQSLGTALGGLAGGVLGNIASDDNKALWTVVGAAAGAFVGNQIGRYLDDQDREKMAQSTQHALNNGKSQSWSSPDNGTAGRATVVSSQTRTEQVAVPVLKEKVKNVPPLSFEEGGVFRAKKSANVRGGPGTDYVLVGSVEAGESVSVIGKVKHEPWFMIGKSGVGSGFIYAPLVTKDTEAPSQAAAAQIAKADIVTHEATVETLCRTVEQSVTAKDGTQHIETVTACKGPNGWQPAA